MGTLRYAVVKYGKVKGNGQAQVMGSDYSQAASYTTSTTASFVENASTTDITVYPDDIFYCIPDEDMTIRFGGAVATANLGIPLAAGVPAWIEVRSSGKVSVIDIS